MLKRSFLLHFFISGEKWDTHSLKHAPPVFIKGSADIIDFYIITGLLPTWGQWETSKQASKQNTDILFMYPSIMFLATLSNIHSPFSLRTTPSPVGNISSRQTLHHVFNFIWCWAGYVFSAPQFWECLDPKNSKVVKKTNKFKVAINLSMSSWDNSNYYWVSYYTFNRLLQ